MEKTSRPVRNRRHSRRAWPLGDINRPIKRLFTPEIKRMLKDWLVRRRDNPYPSREEKKALAIKTGLTYIQICIWFANCRRKLKNAGREPQKKTWGHLIKNYNTSANGNVEQFSICSRDSIWGNNSSLPEDTLVAIQLLSGIIAKDNPNEFGGLLKTLSKILQSYQELSIRLRAFLIQCLGELCANLRVHSVSHLHRFTITDVLNDLLTHKIDVTSPAFEMILKAIYRIVETVPKFLTPYLVNLITSLSVLWSRLQSTASNDSQKNLLKLDEIWQKLASSLELRVLIPMVEKHIYPDLLTQGKFSATGPLMVLLLDSFKYSDRADLTQNCQDLTTFFIAAMDFRLKFHRECDTVEVQEDFFIKTLIGFILKLTEESFRPFYYKLLEWSKETTDKSFDRPITFYRLSGKVAESLKSLFITFAPSIVPHSADLLKKKFTKSETKASSAPPTTLIYNIVATLQTIFLHGNHQFINSQRFSVLMEPLVDLLDNEEYLADERITDILPKCLAQLAVEANNDLLWKQLNQQILKKTRSTSVVVRRWALLCSAEVVIQLGEDATQLYQEMIPFFSELLEDDDADIQKLCSKCITEIERVTGEDLKKHL